MKYREAFSPQEEVSFLGLDLSSRLDGGLLEGKSPGWLTSPGPPGSQSSRCIPAGSANVCRIHLQEGGLWWGCVRVGDASDTQQVVGLLAGRAGAGLLIPLSQQRWPGQWPKAGGEGGCLPIGEHLTHCVCLLALLAAPVYLTNVF